MSQIPPGAGRRLKGRRFMNRKLIIVGTIAVLAFGATYIFLGSAPNSAPSPSAAAAPKIDLEQVLVAAQDLPMGTLVNDNSHVLAGLAESCGFGIHDHQIGEGRMRSRM